MESLATYDVWARKMITMYRRKYGKLEYSDELIGTVIRYMANVDKKFAEIKDDGELKRLRKMGAIFGIRTYLKEQNKAFENFEPVSDGVTSIGVDHIDEKRLKLLKFLMKSAQLSCNEKLVINKYLEGKEYDAIATELGLSYSSVYKSYQNAILKMRAISNGKVCTTNN